MCSASQRGRSRHHIMLNTLVFCTIETEGGLSGCQSIGVHALSLLRCTVQWRGVIVNRVCSIAISASMNPFMCVSGEEAGRGPLRQI